MPVAIVSSSVWEKSLKTRLIVTDMLRSAAAVIKKIFYMLLFLFNAKFCELWTEEVQKLQADVKHAWWVLQCY